MTNADRYAAAAVTVIVPTYHRPLHLRSCLEGLAAQTRPADEVIVVRRIDDTDTELELAKKRQGRSLKTVTVPVPGVLAAMAAGVRAASGTILAFTDDDAVPRSDWIQRMLAVFADPRVGAVGGRDVIHHPSYADEPLTEDVGRITWWGKLIANHHRGVGPAREVMVLKGVNMAFRHEALRLPAGLRGDGAQKHFEVGLCVTTRRAGWRLIYDPSTLVDHYWGPRSGGDQRQGADSLSVRDGAYNLVFGMVGAQPGVYWRRAAYGLLIGDRGEPGIARALAGVVRSEADVWRRLIPSLSGQLQALIDLSRGRRPSFATA